MSARALRALGIGLILTGAVWALLWGGWVAAQHAQGRLDLAAALLGLLLFALLPTAVSWVAAAVVLIRARRRGGQEADADLEVRIAEAVRTRGVVRLGQLATEWGVEETVLRRALEQLVGLNLLAGNVDWERGEITAPFAGVHEACSHCGGQLEPAGKGLLVCRYCGSHFPVKDAGHPAGDGVTKGRSDGDPPPGG